MNTSLSSILNIARGAISANQRGVQTTSQNIANAQTDGYSRRTVSFVETRPVATAVGQLGSGVQAHSIRRVRDQLLDASFRQESGKASGFQARAQVLGEVEQIFGEPSDDGLAASLDAFWSAWSDLSSRPTNPTARRLVQQQGEQVAATLRSFDRRLADVEQRATHRLNDTLSQVNGVAEQVAKLNREITVAEATGGEAFDLHDQRDRLLDELSKLGNVRVLDRGRGSIAVMVENATIVDGANHKSITASGNPVTLSADGLTLSFGADRSALGELAHQLRTELPGVRTRLDELASALVEQVNALHTSGFTTGGAAGGNFFSGTSAATIALDGAIAGDPSLIVTSDTAGQSTNNRIALAMAALKGRPSDNSIGQTLPAWTAVSGNLSGISFGEYYEDVVSETAFGVSSAEHSVQVYKSVTEQADARRQSVSGVSTDEELIRLMNYQQAYTAATKMVRTVDEMLQSVLDMV